MKGGFSLFRQVFAVAIAICSSPEACPLFRMQGTDGERRALGGRVLLRCRRRLASSTGTRRMAGRAAVLPHHDCKALFYPSRTAGC